MSYSIAPEDSYENFFWMPLWDLGVLKELPFVNLNVEDRRAQTIALMLEEQKIVLELHGGLSSQRIHSF